MKDSDTTETTYLSQSKSFKKGIVGLVKIVLPVALGVYICYYFWNSFDDKAKSAFGLVFTEVNYFILLISVVIGLLSHISRSLRWRFVLEPLGYKPSLFNSYNAIMIGYLANIVAPRMGEASRAGVLRATDNVPFDKAFGTIMAERVIDVICLAVICGLAMLFNLNNLDDLLLLADNISGTPANDGMSWTKIVLLSVVAVAFISFVILYNLKAKFRQKVKQFFTGLMEGVKAILKMQKRKEFILHTLFIWGCYVAMFWLPFYAWEGTAHIRVDGILSAFISGTLGFIVVQGGIGLYPIMVGIVLTFFLAPDYLAVHKAPMPEHIGFATLLWATQTLLIVTLGLIALLSVRKKRVY